MKDQAEKEPELQLYVPHLQNNTILRLLQQVWVKKMFVTMRKLEVLSLEMGLGGLFWIFCVQLFYKMHISLTCFPYK